MNKKNTFLAATVAGAMAVTAVAAPVNAATFTDVSDRYKEAVNYLVANNITKGVAKDKFGTEAQITRVDAAVMIAKALKLDTTNAKSAGFTDVPARAQGAVNALKEKGIINGKSETRFGADDKITRGEMAIILQRAYNLKGDGNIAFTDVGSRYTNAVKAMVAHNITNGISKDKFGTSAPIKRGDFAIFLYKSATLDKTPVDTQAKVESVVLNSPYETEIKYSSPIKESSAKKKDNYEVNGLTPDYAYLKKDKKTVVLQFNKNNKKSLETTDEAWYKVKPLETTQNVMTEPYEKKYTYVDIQAPSIIHSEFNNGKIVIHFNELLKDVPENVLVNGKKLTKEQYKINPEAKKQLLIDYELTKDDKAAVVLTNVKDTAKETNVAKRLETTVDVPKLETVEPKIEKLNAMNHKEVFIQFNTAIQEEEFTAQLSYGPKKYDVKFERSDVPTAYVGKIPSEALKGVDERTFDFYILEGTISSNTAKNKELSTTLQVKRDTTPPTYQDHSYTVEGDRTVLTMSFDKDIETLQKGERKITVVNENNTSYDVETVLYSKRTLKIYMKEKLPENKYTVTIPKGFVKDQFGNKAEGIVKMYDIRTATDTTPPTVENVEVKKPESLGDPFSYLITYSEPINDSAILKSSYAINDKPLPAKATAVFVNDKDRRVVQITFNEGSYNSGDALTGTSANLTIKGVQDLAGNTMAETFEKSVEIFDNTPAKPLDIKVNKEAKTATLLFDEPLQLTDTGVNVSKVFKASNLKSFSFDAEKPQEVVLTFKRIKDENQLNIGTAPGQTYLLDTNGYPVKF